MEDSLDELKAPAIPRHPEEVVRAEQGDGEAYKRSLPATRSRDSYPRRVAGTSSSFLAILGSG